MGNWRREGFSPLTRDARYMVQSGRANETVQRDSHPRYLLLSQGFPTATTLAAWAGLPGLGCH